MRNYDPAIVVLLAANLLTGILLLAILLRRPVAAWCRRSLDRMPLFGAGAAAPGRFDASRAIEPVHARSVMLPTDGGLLAAAISRSAGFLRRRLRTGTYGLSCVGDDDAPRFSDNKGHVFVASFVTEALSGRLGEIDRALVLARILSEENRGQWGFSPPGPFHGADTLIFHVDADDTACVLRTLRRLGVNRSPECLLKYYRSPQRLFATFNAPGSTRISTDPSVADNLLAHPEVNANVFLALRGTQLESFAACDLLPTWQDPAGGWRSYFYPSALYGTLIALDALAGRRAFSEAVRRGLRFVADSQHADGSWGAADPYETALGVAALAGHHAHAAAVARGVDCLLATIGDDGSWTSRACIWEFHAAGDDVWRAYDPHRAYVTARCAIALRRAVGELTAFS